MKAEMKKGLAAVAVLVLAVILVLSVISPLRDRNGDGSGDEGSDFDYDPNCGPAPCGNGNGTTVVHGEVMYRLNVDYADGTTEELTEKAALFQMLDITRGGKLVQGFRYGVFVKFTCDPEPCELTSSVDNVLARASISPSKDLDPTQLTPGAVKTYSSKSAVSVPEGAWTQILPGGSLSPTAQDLEAAAQLVGLTGRMYLTFYGGFSFHVSLAPYANPYKDGAAQWHWPWLELEYTPASTEEPPLGGDGRTILRGHVYMLGTTTPIQGAALTAGGTGPVYTDGSGYYSFDFIQGGNQVLSVTKSGYNPLDVQVYVQAGMTNTVNVGLWATSRCGPGCRPVSITSFRVGSPTFTFQYVGLQEVPTSIDGLPLTLTMLARGDAPWGSWCVSTQDGPLAPDAASMDWTVRG